MSKTTAVDWLINQMPFEYTSNRAAFEAIQIAKQMEREQIEDAYVEGCNNTYGNDEPNPNHSDSQYAQDYYEQTYGGNNDRN